MRICREREKYQKNDRYREKHTDIDTRAILKVSEIVNIYEIIEIFEILEIS